MIKVQHKSGKFSSDIKSKIYVLWHLGFMNEDISIKFKATKDCLRTDGNTSWMKVCGFKSSIITNTNSESLFAFRTNKKGNLETSYYFRNGADYPNHWFTTHVEEHDFRIDGEVYKRNLKLARRWKEWIPAFPWAGGKVKPTNDLWYELELK